MPTLAVQTQLLLDAPVTAPPVDSGDSQNGYVPWQSVVLGSLGGALQVGWDWWIRWRTLRRMDGRG